MGDEFPALCCLYNAPYFSPSPWICVTCKMLHAVRCEPEPSSEDGVPPRELWLAAELADINRELVGNDYHADWRRFLEDAYIDAILEAQP